MERTRTAGKISKLRIRAVSGLALFALLAGTAVAVAGSGSPYPSDESTQGPFAPKDCAYPRERPLRLVLRCEGLEVLVNDIRWKTWGQGRAQGEGRLEFERRRYPVKLEIRRVRNRLCGDERLPMFTRVSVDFKNKRPDIKRPPRKLRCSLLDSGWTP